MTWRELKEEVNKVRGEYLNAKVKVFDENTQEWREKVETAPKMNNRPYLFLEESSK